MSSPADLKFYSIADLPRERAGAVGEGAPVGKGVRVAAVLAVSAGLFAVPLLWAEGLERAGIPPSLLLYGGAAIAFLVLLAFRRDQIPRRRGDLVFREARLGKGLGFVITAAVAAGVLAAPTLMPELLDRTDSPPYLAYYVGGVLAMISLFPLAGFRASLRPSNWLVLAAAEGLYLKYRSYLNHTFPAEDPTVVFIPGRAVAALRKAREVTLRPDDKGTGDARVRRAYLEIRLGHEDTDELAAYLRRERQRQAPGFAGSKLKRLHYPVRTRPGGIVQVDWAGPDTAIRPRIDRAVKLLGRWFVVEGALESEQEPAEGLSREAQEARLLDLAERGETIQAVTLAKRLYGWGTTEADRFVKDLIGK